MRTIVGHNVYAYDCIAMERDGVVFDYDYVEDTILAMHAYASHLPLRLDQGVSTYLDSSPWKIKHGRRGQEEKGLLPHQLSPEERALYNSSDCCLSSALWDAVQVDLEAERAVYEHDKKLALLCQGMTKAGIRVDTDRQAELSKKLRYRMAALLGEMRSLTNKQSFSPMKPAHIRKALYGKFGAPMIGKPTETGLAPTSKFVLQALRGQDTRAGKLADLILRYRKARKARSTYVDSLAIYDGRVHFNWKAFGTVSGRLSSRFQQLPRKTKKNELEDRIRELYIPAEGCEFVYFDLSQAEMRCASQLSGDPRFIAVCAQKDVHSANACIIFPHAVDDILNDPKGKGKMYRDIAKNVGFAVNYLAGEETLFLYLQGQDLPRPVTMREVRAMLTIVRREFSKHFQYIEANVERAKRLGYIRSPILGRIRWCGWSPVPAEIANCLDDKTEALTPRGWVCGPDLKVGDKLLTKNADTGELTWQATSRIFRYPKYKGPLIEFKSQSFNAVTTPDHRWLAHDRKTGRDLCVTSADLADGLGGYSIHRTGRYVAPKAEIYTNNFVELIGWLMTDGTVIPPGRQSSPRIIIYQSTRGNPKKVRQIDALVARLGEQCDRRLVKHGGVQWHFTAGKSITAAVGKLFPDRTLSFEFLLSLTGPQLELLQETMMLGDGSYGKLSHGGDHRRFTCRDSARADAFQLLCTLNGIATTRRWRGPAQPKKQYATISNRPKSQGCWIITLLRRSTAQVLVHKKCYGKNRQRVNQVRRFESAQSVWCPVVRNTYFVARREGDVYVTGNSPVQSCVADLMNARLISAVPKLPDGARLVAQVHDAGVFECKKGEARRHTEELIKEMWDEEVVLPESGRRFRLPIDQKSGERLSELG